MNRRLTLAALAATLIAAPMALAAPKPKPPMAPAAPAPSLSDILARSPASDWAPLDPDNTLYMDLKGGRVIIELAPQFAPAHVANIKALVRAGYFDDSRIVRSQDNYVVQWSAPEGRPVKPPAKATLSAEFERPAGSERFVRLPDPDTYAAAVGFVGDVPAARDAAQRLTWPVHCYGMVGAGRDAGADTGGGTELYAVIGEAPRNLDRNVTLVGRVVRGMELLSTLPRGTGDLGFYKTEGEKSPILRVRIAADLPAAERAPLEALRTDSRTFHTVVETRRFRRDDWYKYAWGRVGVCNVPLPVRDAAH